MEYILFIHNNNDIKTESSQWDEFFEEANKSDMFLGGSEITYLCQLGKEKIKRASDNVGGFMRFETGTKDALLDLLTRHPVYLAGGTLELCEMPKS
ncbi:MAG: hypothetical protein ACRBCI_05205 [Cellvibrionaceae bacterium]